MLLFDSNSSKTMNTKVISCPEVEGYVSSELCDQINQIIDQTEKCKDKILLLKCEHNAKGKEVKSEYNLLKDVGGLCTRSCKYYFQTNLSFVESSQHFHILFKAFRESLNNLKKKLQEVECMKEKIKKYKEEEEMKRKEKKDRNDAMQKHVHELDTSLSFMKSDTEHIEHKMKEVREQMIQHTEAYESFLDISNANNGKKNIMCDFLVELQNQYEQIEKEITEEKEQKKIEEEEFLLQKKEKEAYKEELIKKEADLKFTKENKILRKKEVSGNNSIVESQEQILENQIKSQDYFLNMLISSVEDGVKRKKELENKMETVNKDIKMLAKTIKDIEINKEKEKMCDKKLKNKITLLEKKYKEKEEEWSNIKKEEGVIHVKVEDERSQLNSHVLSLLKEKQTHINDKIGNYKLEIQKTIKQEQDNILMLKEIDLETEPSNIITQLELIIEHIKNEITEEQKTEWCKQKEQQTIQKNISDIQKKISEEKQKSLEMNESIKIQKKQIKEFYKKNEKIEKRVYVLREETQKKVNEQQKKQEELNKIEKQMEELTKKEYERIIELEEEYDQKIQSIYDTKNSFESLDNEENDQRKKELVTYFKTLQEEYEQKKKDFEKEVDLEQEEERNTLHKDIKNKEDLLEYYKVLISKYVVPVEGSKKRRSKNKKGEQTGVGVSHKKNKKERTVMKNSNKVKNSSRMKWLLTDEPHKFAYFDLTSQDFIKNNNTHNNEQSPSKSPHINRILEKIKQRTNNNVKETTSNKDVKNYSTNSNGIKNTVTFNTNNNNMNHDENTISQKTKASSSTTTTTTHPTYDIFQHL